MQGAADAVIQKGHWGLGALETVALKQDRSS